MQIANFETHMKAMKSHYKGDIFLRYSLPIHAVDNYQIYKLAEGSDEFDVDLKTAIEDSQANLRQSLEQPKEKIVKATEALGKNPKPSEFDQFQQELERRRKEAKENASNKIDAMFDNFLEVGKDHPEMQSTILSTIDKIGAFFNLIWDKVTAFFSDLAKNIMSWIKEAVNKVKNFFLDSFHAVTSFFGAFRTSSPILAAQAGNEDDKLWEGLMDEMKKADKLIGTQAYITIKYDYPEVKEEIEKLFDKPQILEEVSFDPKPIDWGKIIAKLGDLTLKAGTIMWLANLIVKHKYEAVIDLANSKIILKPSP